jgi:hypothetical protein
LTTHTIISEDTMTTQTQTQTQTQATGNATDPINFENYALLYDELTTTQADLDEESCPLPYWGIIPDDRELSSL